jgi:hypothetical protein
MSACSRGRAVGDVVHERAEHDVPAVAAQRKFSTLHDFMEEPAR